MIVFNFWGGGRCGSLSVLALAGILGASSGVAAGAEVSVGIQSYVNANIQTYTNGSNYPDGGTVLTNGNISFTLAYYSDTSGTGAIQTPPGTTSYDIPVDIDNPTAVYTLINSAYGEFGDTVGSVVFKATGGLEYTVDLVEGQNIRDQNNGVYNNVIGTGSLGPTYLNTFSFGPVRLDEQEFILPSSFNSATLTDIILNGTGNVPDGTPLLAAATVVTASIPEPTSLVMLGVGIITAWWRRGWRF